MLPDHREYVFVDTPGFNGAVRPATDVLHTITDWLAEKYKEGTLLTGVIFTHDVTNRQTHGSLYDILCCLCGDKAASRVRLVTTMWDKVEDFGLAETTVSRMEKCIWKPLLDAGARHMRFENSKQSAWDIVQDLRMEREPLLLQQELVDARKHLYETFAGHALYLQFQKLTREEVQPNRQFWRFAGRRQVRRPVEQFQAECKHIEKQLQKARKERRRLQMQHHPYWRRWSCLLFNPNPSIPEVTENDFVIL
ncbi:hypothetical protein PISMIDRAFT_120524 [Pisolithus microcarpus 441]|uniref:G domain-containing protein n=1 Tax=Pisolithus microcarpus 441 TaxID=765257 RepID=A0A0C9YXH4_9AGAM|nr:hypothetical protein PISMIDRAFT_120524 [Pisolithus microcarpus 441]